MPQIDLFNMVNFLFEVKHLENRLRSGFCFLGLRGRVQSVSEHTSGVVFVGYALSSFFEGVDVSRVMKMCLFHDLSEARVSDLDYVSQKYNDRKEDKARKELAANVPFGQEMLNILEEFEKGETLEAKIAKDADQLDLLLSIRDIVFSGNNRPLSWVPSLLLRLKTDEAKNLAKKILETDPDKWWFENKSDHHWIDPSKK